MIDLKFTVGGKSVSADRFGEALMKAAAEKVAAEIRERLSAVRLPETGEFPTVVVHGSTLEDLSIGVEGSPELLALVRARFTKDELQLMRFQSTALTTMPRVFLSYASEDEALAERLAKALQANGIDTWWAGWSIGAGDSLRQRIDAGLSECTHFLVLLTPTAVAKPWVNQEMDAGLVRKLDDETSFIAVRAGLGVSALPPLLKGMLSPSIDDFDADVVQLINDIHGVSRKPALGPPPPSTGFVAAGYSAAATAVARAFVEASATAMFGDPQRSVPALAETLGLTEEDVRDALHELRSFFTVSHGRALPNDELFVMFDHHFMGWDPAADALTLAADLVNDPSFPKRLPEMAARYAWPARRLNPAVAFLMNRELVIGRRVLGTRPFITSSVQPKADVTRRFVKSRT